jgi:CHAT domain-containing protein
MLSISYYCNNNHESAIAFYNKNYNAINNETFIVFSLDEKSRLAWQNTNLDFWFTPFLDAKTLAQVSLQRKGIILETILEDRALAFSANSSPDAAEVIQEINSLQTQLSRSIIQNSNNNEYINELQDKISRLQRELSAKYLGRDRQRSSATMKMANIMPSLSGGGVLMDFIQFNDPKLKADEAACLGAIISGEDNEPVFVRIDGGSDINRAIDYLRAAINQGNSIEVEAQTKFLSEKLWAPIAAKIPEGTKRLFLCPDANLNFLSFAALLESDGRFVAEKYPITYIGSARDLAKKPSGKISKSMALIANPQFDAAEKNAKTNDLVAMRSAEADVFGSIALPPLPGTEAEAASLQSLAAESGWQTKSCLGKDATETSVRNTKKPGVLHLATHGFYLNSFTPPGPEGSRGMSVVSAKETTEEKKKNEKGVDPMRASGVAFTGAQQTLTSWSQRKAPNPETDGVLTAEEVGALRLDGTWLVVLSACETGVGEARSGEGVFGLRRAFMIAGAENLLMTLWPVADETTAKIMTDFYKEAFATGDAPGSLAKVQRDWLVKLRQERGLLAAVREAGPFAMVTMTNPNAQREFVEGQLNEDKEISASKESTESKQPAEAAESSSEDNTILEDLLIATPNVSQKEVSNFLEGARAYNKHLNKANDILQKALAGAKSQNDKETLNLILEEGGRELKDLNERIVKREQAIAQAGWPTKSEKNQYQAELDKAKAEKHKLEIILKQAKETAILSN